MAEKNPYSTYESQSMSGGDVRLKDTYLNTQNTESSSDDIRLRQALDALLSMQGISELSGRERNPIDELDRDPLASRVDMHESGDRENQYKRPRVMPDQYDGKTSWVDYLGHFEIVAELNNWNDRLKAQYLSVSLRGPASQVLRALPTEKRKTYKDIVIALERRFNPENQTELYRAQLRNRQRKTQESLPELAQDIRRLVMLAYPNASMEMQDVLAKDYFIDALDDKDLRWRIYQIKAKTLDEAVCGTIEMEAYIKAELQRTQGLKQVRAVEVQDKFQHNNKQQESDLIKSIDQLTKLLSLQLNRNNGPSQYNRSTKPSFRDDRKGCWNCENLIITRKIAQDLNTQISQTRWD
jgi:hypothetical protein